MTNEAISAILEHLCNEARNSVHATFGAMELGRAAHANSSRAPVAMGKASADQLLRSIDDVRDLLSTAIPDSAALERFDVAGCAREIVEMLNLTSRKRRCHMVLDALPGELPVTQDRKAVEQVLTRVLDTAFKLTPSSDIHVTLTPRGVDNGVRLAVNARDANLAVRLTKWLQAHPDQAVLQDPNDVSFEVAVMVAGKRLRELGGSAELEHDSAGHCAVALDLPSQAQGKCPGKALRHETHPDALNILVAEDCDDSFVLSEMVLQSEHVSRAHDGREALRMLQKQRFDMVLMDVHMPEMDGYQVIRGMRDWETQTGNARIPMVILSSDDIETQRRSAAECGCSGFLRKPLRRKDLMNLLDRLKRSRMPVA